MLAQLAIRTLPVAFESNALDFAAASSRDVIGNDTVPRVLLQAAPVGAIKGYLKDSSGASIQGATLKLRDEKTGVQTTAQSDANGLYQFLNLNPSVYSISASANGFSDREAKNITVLVGQIVSFDFNLSIAAVSQSVDVSAGTEVLQTEKASTGTNITDKLVGNLPLVNRRFNDLAILTPGVSFAAPGSQAGAFASAGTRSLYYRPGRLWSSGYPPIALWRG